jgi:hypothetical protein
MRQLGVHFADMSHGLRMRSDMASRTIGAGVDPTARGVYQMHAGLQTVELTVVDTNTAEWGAFPIPQLGVDLPVMQLIDDPDTGMQVLKVIYRRVHQHLAHAPMCTWHLRLGGNA